MSVKYIPGPPPLKGEVPLKRWCVEQALKEGVTWKAIYGRFVRRRYFGLTVRRVNKRVIFVKP